MRYDLWHVHRFVYICLVFLSFYFLVPSAVMMRIVIVNWLWEFLSFFLHPCNILRAYHDGY